MAMTMEDGIRKMKAEALADAEAARRSLSRASRAFASLVALEECMETDLHVKSVETALVYLKRCEDCFIHFLATLNYVRAVERSVGGAGLGEALVASGRLSLAERGIPTGHGASPNRLHEPPLIPVFNFCDHADYADRVAAQLGHMAP